MSAIAASTGGRSSTRGATRPSRSTSCSSPAPGRAGGALRRLDRRARGGRAARRRRRLGRQGRHAGGRERNGEIAAAVLGARRPRPARGRPRLIELDGTPNKGRLGRERDPGRLARSGEGRRGRRRASALPLSRRRRGAHAARADAERHERRRARENSIDLQEFMVVPTGAATFAGACGWAPRSSTRSRRLARRGLSTGVGDEGGFAPDLGRATRRSKRCWTRSSARATASAWRSRSIPRRREFYRDGAYDFEGARRTRGHGRVLPGAGRRTPSSPSRTARRGRLGQVERLTEALGDRMQLVGDDLFVTNVERLRRGIDAGSATRSSSR